MRFYAGIGSRETPPAFLQVMRETAVSLALQGMTLRSGGASGADTAFEEGHVAAQRAKKGIASAEIYLPWSGFNNHASSRIARDLPGCCTAVARDHHPNWRTAKTPTRWMHVRNSAQVLGEDCQTPSEFVLCWTPGGAGGGGTGQAIRVAKSYSIPVFDLGMHNWPYIRRKLAEHFGVKV